MDLICVLVFSANVETSLLIRVLVSPERAKVESSLKVSVELQGNSIASRQTKRKDVQTNVYVFAVPAVQGRRIDIRILQVY